MKERQHVVGQILHRPLLRARHNLTRKAAVFDQEVRADSRRPAGARMRVQTLTNGSSPCRAATRGSARCAGGEEVFFARGMRAEEQHHRNILHALECDVVTGPDFHVSLPPENASDKPEDFSSFPRSGWEKSGNSLCSVLYKT
jgi:hypothetical protein